MSGMAARFDFKLSSQASGVEFHMLWLETVEQDSRDLRLPDARWTWVSVQRLELSYHNMKT